MKKILFILFLLLVPIVRAQKFANIPRTANELALLEQKAQAGDIRSQYELGCCYLEGVDGLLTRKISKGKSLLKKAAKSGSADACRMLFKLDPFHNDGYREQAIAIYKTEKSGEAYYKIADMYATNPKTCQRWLKSALQMGYTMAEKDLRTLWSKNGSGETFDRWLEDIVAIDVNTTTTVLPKQDSPDPNKNTPSVTVASLSDVDKDLPRADILNSKTIAVIIGSEKYKYLAPVSYAQNDAGMFARYCETTLGLPKQNIKLRYDVTLGEMTDLIEEQLPRYVKQIGSDANIIFYYAGHGFPDEQTRAACLVPVDAHNVKSKSVYSLDKLTSQLSSLGAAHVAVFLDACFSGAQRGDGMLADARSVAIAPEEYEVEGNNIVVFSAASGDQTAWPYHAKRHGLFTYYLLKSLQETAGNVSLGDLSDKLKKDVEYTSTNLNTSQSPVTNASASEWRSWKLK